MPTIEPNKPVPRVEYSEEELEQRSRILVDASHARNQKQQKYAELDDMDYDTWYFKSKKATQAYIQPKTNDEDVRVVTGTTREKSNIIVNTFLNYNLEPDVVAYDDKNVIQQELGEMVEKMIRKSRNLELPDYDVKKPLIIKEFVDQGNVFVRESWNEYEIPSKELEKLNWSEGVDPSKKPWKDKLSMVYAQCNSTMITGLELYPGNARQFFMELQPFVIVRKVITYSEAKAMFKKWKRFKYVSDQLDQATELETSVTYDDYQMIKTDADLVEVVEYFNKWNNEYQIMLNGVLMLPVGYPLSGAIGVCEYPISKGDAEPISPNFFWSRGVGAKNKMDQAIMDEMYKMMIIKTRKSYKPPLANKGNYNIGPNVYMPGKIFKGIDPEKLKPIGDNNGVTPAEFNMTQFVNEVINSKTVSSIMEGQEPENKATARQVIEQKQQSMVKMGMMMLGMINLETRMAWLRLYNIINNWTESVDTRMVETKDGVSDQVKVYKSVSMKDTLENGQEGERIIEFNDNVPALSQVYAEEEIIQQTSGRKVRKNYINPEMLRNAKMMWEINMTPTEKNTSMLKAAMFTEYLQEVLATFVPLGLVPDLQYLATRHTLVNDESPDKVWGGKMQPQPQQPQLMLGQQTSQRREALTPQRENKPSINTMQGA